MATERLQMPYCIRYIMKQQPSPSLIINLFGTFDVRLDGAPVLGWRSEKTRWLLAYLALHRGEATYALLQSVVGGSAGADPRNEFANVRQSLVNLGELLGRDRFLKPTRSSVLLNFEGVETDVLAFDAAMQAGDIPALQRAVTLYRGPLLPGCGEAWAVAAREKTAQQYAQALSALTLDAAGSGEFAAAERCLRLSVAADPLREGVRCDLMRLLAKQGEDNAALRVYRDLLDLLRADPRAKPGAHITDLYQRLQARMRDPVGGSADGGSANSVPATAPQWRFPFPLPALVGREEALREVSARLLLKRLVTLTGPPGVGKTLLALHAAVDCAPDFHHVGCCLDLTGKNARRDMVRQLVTMLEVSVGQQGEEEALVEHLRGRSALLVLDNCGPVLPVCVPLVRDLLSQCPHLHVLATSRQALEVTGESVYAVAPLSVPPTSLLARSAKTLPSLLPAFAAVRLFVQRAQDADATFTLSAGNAKAVAAVCCRLDGLPLAVEMVAAWANTLTPYEMVAHLAEPQTALTGNRSHRAGRHSSLQAAIGASAALLPSPSRRLLAELSVFHGGWTPETAAAICEAPASVQELRELQTQSLLSTTDTGERKRFRLLEPVREYARTLLTSGEYAALARRHTEYFLQVALDAEPYLTGAEQAQWLQRLEQEHDNMEAALTWMLEVQEIQKGLQLAGALWRFWYARGRSREGLEWLTCLLNGGPEQTDAVRLKAVGAAGNLAFQQGDNAQARRFFTQHLALAETLGKPRVVAGALGSLGNVALEEGDLSAARAAFDRCLAVFEELHDTRGMALTRDNLGIVACREGQYDLACEHHEASAILFEELGDPLNLAMALNNLVETVLLSGDAPRAGSLLRRSLALSQELGSPRLALHGLALAFHLAMMHNRLEAAGTLAGLVEGACEQTGENLPASALATYQRQCAEVERHLGLHAYREARSRAEARTQAQALAFALEVVEALPPSGASAFSTLPRPSSLPPAR